MYPFQESNYFERIGDSYYPKEGFAVYYKDRKVRTLQVHPVTRAVTIHHGSFNHTEAVLPFALAVFEHRRVDDIVVDA